MNISCTKRTGFSIFLTILTVAMSPLRLIAQDSLPMPTSIPAMVNQNANRLINPEAINGFLSKLRRLEKGDTVNVKILHIGDSHIYADLMTGMERQLFQQRFGIGCSNQLFRFKLAEFQDSMKTDYITPLPCDSIRRKGVCYFMAGANGAEYATYNQKSEFFKQTALLQPDLVIISMGTNEAFGSLEQNIFENNIDAFVSQIRWYNPHAEILITTPGDAMKRKRIHNTAIDQARNILLNYASVNDAAVWDLNTIMGGKGSIKKWYSAGLSQKDRVHYSREGYFLQAYLLFKALMNELDTPANQR